jgi:hypothetical protein
MIFLHLGIKLRTALHVQLDAAHLRLEFQRTTNKQQLAFVYISYCSNDGQVGFT